MKLGIPKEHAANEQRVAATPDTTRKLIKFGFEVLIESGAGEKANFSDSLYQEAGATIIGNAADLWKQSDWVMKVREPSPTEVELLSPGKGLISFLWPAQNADLLERLNATGATVIAMDMVPRISRAQKLDALSSMANCSGYRAVIEAAQCFPRFFTGQITAAGKVPPCKVMVIGAGVAGLAAIGAARGLGAVVRAFDVRPSVKEQVESMGAEFLEVEMEESGEGSGGYAKEMSKEFIEAEMALFRQQAREVDIIITTALIPGRPAPKLILADMVPLMRAGSVIVDLASEQGGNCELTEPGKSVVKHGVTIIGYTDLPSRMASQSSQLYGQNIVHLLDDMGRAEKFSVNFDDVVVRGATVCHQGKVTYPPPKVEVSAAPAKPAASATASAASDAKKKQSSGVMTKVMLALVAFALAGASQAGPDFLNHMTVFVLAILVGWLVVWNVNHALHTPLMSVTNAISGIILVGGMLMITGDLSSPVTWIGLIAVFFATINIAGGFLVTQRMLKMFRRG